MFDLIIRGASIIDGTGRAAYTGDAAVSDGRIAAVGELGAAEAARVIEARGRCLTPGFIDIHRHADAAVFRPGWGRAELAQGLTTVINGNCGLSLAPVRGPFAGEILSYLSPIVGALPEGRDFPDMAGYLRAAAGAELPLNTAMLAGMGTIRACAAGFSDAPLTDGQYRGIHALLERCLADGAVGVSLGLGYAPECFYDTAGLIRALEPLRNSGTVVTVHMRQEGDGVVDALREMLSVARELRMPLEISHLQGHRPPQLALRRSGDAAAHRLGASGGSRRHVRRLPLPRGLDTAHPRPAAGVPGGRHRGADRGALRYGAARKDAPEDGDGLGL